MSAFYTDPETGVIYWRDAHGILRPRQLTNSEGGVVGYEQAPGFFPARVGHTDEVLAASRERLSMEDDARALGVDPSDPGASDLREWLA